MDPAKPSRLLLRAACRADVVTRQWHGMAVRPHILVHSMRHLLSQEVIAVLKPRYEFLDAMFS